MFPVEQSIKHTVGQMGVLPEEGIPSPLAPIAHSERGRTQSLKPKFLSAHAPCEDIMSSKPEGPASEVLPQKGVPANSPFGGLSKMLPRVM